MPKTNKLRNWKHYFWEFFMIFLAITVGFFVENYQKKKAKDKAEVEFVKSFKNDLINDIYQLDKLIDIRKEREIRIIHIWEDDWNLKKDIIKSQITNWLGLTKNKIYARKCIIKEVIDISEYREFLDENHIQGYTSASKKIGLYYDDELVSLMTFDHFEGRKSMLSDEWNLSRFCNKKNINVIGGASRLMKYFIKNYDVKRIISFSDVSW